MNPVISPWLIYFVGSLSGLEFFFRFLIAVFSIVLIVIFIAWASAGAEGEELEFVKEGKHKVFIFLECLCILAYLLIPSKETVYAMVVAKYVTPNNIEIVGGSVKDSIDYIFEKIDTLTEEKEEK